MINDFDRPEINPIVIGVNNTIDDKILRIIASHDDPKIEIIKFEDPNIIKINGVRYRTHADRTIEFSHKNISTPIIYGHYKKSYGEFEISYKNLIKEFALIQKKKSNLTRSQRSYVVFQFEKIFEKI
jgi:hypothetical protein